MHQMRDIRFVAFLMQSPRINSKRKRKNGRRKKFTKNRFTEKKTKEKTTSTRKRSIIGMNYSKRIAIVIINNKSARRRNTITRLDYLWVRVKTSQRSVVSLLCHLCICANERAHTHPNHCHGPSTESKQEKRFRHRVAGASARTRSRYYNER